MTQSNNTVLFRSSPAIFRVNDKTSASLVNIKLWSQTALDKIYFLIDVHYSLNSFFLCLNNYPYYQSRTKYLAPVLQ